MFIRSCPSCGQGATTHLLRIFLPSLTPGRDSLFTLTALFIASSLHIYGFSKHNRKTFQHNILSIEPLNVQHKKK